MRACAERTADYTFLQSRTDGLALSGRKNTQGHAHTTCATAAGGPKRKLPRTGRSLVKRLHRLYDKSENGRLARGSPREMNPL